MRQRLGFAIAVTLCAQLGSSAESFAQPGRAPTVAPSPSAPPSASRSSSPSASPSASPAPPPPATVEGPREGIHFDRGYSVGTFHVLGRDGEDRIHRLSLGVHSELGVHLSRQVTLLWMNSVVVHHYDTMTRYAKWVWSGDVDKKTWPKDGDFYKRLLTPTIPMAALLDSQIHSLAGVRVHLLPTIQSPYVEAGAGLSLMLDVADGEYGWFYGGTVGGGVQLSERFSLGLRALATPVVEDGGQALAATVQLVLTQH